MRDFRKMCLYSAVIMLALVFAYSPVLAANASENILEAGRAMKEKASEAAEATEQKAEEIEEAVSESLSSAKEKASDALGSAAEATDSAAEKAGNVLKDAQEASAEKAEEAGAAISSTYEDAKAASEEKIEEAGAALSEAADKAAATTKEAVGTAAEATKEAAEKVAEAVQEPKAPAVSTGNKLQDAIAATPSGTGPGEIDSSAPAGYLGIAGAPQINTILALLWAVWVGWIFSTVGAFGGVMAGVGHMTIYGLGAYAKGFKGTSPVLNKTITDSVRASNQCMVGFSALISSINYWRMGRLVFPLALALGGGSLLGAWASATLSAGKVSFSQYQGWFGLFVLALGCYLFWETSPAGQASKKKSKEASKAFEERIKKQGAGDATAETGVKVLGVSLAKVRFTFCGVEFSFNPLLPLVGGVVISAVAAFLGVGGGFLLVPFLTSVTELPMYLAAGTSALAVLISMATSIVTLMTKGTPVDWSLVGMEMVGVAIGSVIGPRTSKYIPEKALKIIFIVLALFVGARYVYRGFF